MLLLQAGCPEPGKQFPGFTPAKSLPTGAGMPQNFQATLANLLPPDPEIEDKPQKDSGKKTTSEAVPDAVSGVPVPVPVPAADTLPFHLALPMPVKPINDLQPERKLATTDAPGPAEAKTKQPQVAPRTPGASPKKPVVPTYEGMQPSALSPATPVIFHAVSDQTGKTALETLTSTAHTISRGQVDPIIIPAETRVTAHETDPSAPELPHLSFTGKITATASAAAVESPAPTAPALVASVQTQSKFHLVDDHHTDSKPAPSGETTPPQAPKGEGPGYVSERRDGADDHNHSSGESPAAKPTPGSSVHMAAPPETFSTRLDSVSAMPIAPKVAANPASSGSPPSSKAAEVTHLETEPTGQPSSPSIHPQAETHAISLRLAVTADQRIELKVTEHAGEVKVAVRTADADLAGSLRENLGDLVHKLEQSGFRAETWHPGQSGTTANDHRENPQEARSSSGNHPGQQQQSGDGRQRKRQHEQSGWIEEMERTITVDAERSTPAWVPASTL
jgi:hypothetical protein